ncbi:uncharacterized protein LOC131675520 [Phymastichus coffea]|uniref:uncharacterized protein LOC131675520 n=1 Tax=Phymastichus coffea TaxID=108790 RepID=UPI00273C3F57|nr:uncharacterized protein LOC131675520 [Phymastichus coffea]
MTDHSSLQWLKSMKGPTNRLARWIIYLQELDYEIVIIKGIHNDLADPLSRMFEEEKLQLASVTWSQTTKDEWYRQQYQKTQNTQKTIRDGKSSEKSSNAATIIEELHKLINRIGTPEVFHSNNGSEFKNTEVDDLLISKKIIHSTTPVHHPQANPVERVNRTLKAMIRSYIVDSYLKWDRNLPELSFALNTAVSSATGKSTAQLIYGCILDPPNTVRKQQDRLAQDELQRSLADRWYEHMQELTQTL